jgi:two-component system, chemotaxis family, sensor kinase CheA
MIEQDELLAEFIDEALQHFQTIEPDLLELEREGDQIDQEIVNRLFRGMHSIKGAAGFFGLKNINDLGHAMENLLSLVREKRISVDSDLVDSLLGGTDILRSMVEDVGSSDTIDISGIMELLQNKLNTTSISIKKVKLFEILGNGKKGRDFDLPEDTVKRFVKGGNKIYSVEVYLNKDIADQDKTPFDFINNMTSTGEFLNISFSFDKINGLEDCLDNELSLVFLFSTIMEKELVPMALELPEEQVKEINLDNFIQRIKKNLELKPVKKDQKEENPLVAEPEKIESDTQQDSGGKMEGTTNAARQIESEEKIRVGVNIMNDLMNLAGELVLGRNQLMQTALPLIKDVQGLNPVLQHVSSITTEMQGKIMQMRMQPVSALFSKFHRVVRELAKKLGKEINLVTFGEDVELDKTIIEALSDPMTHLIRNCCDHAIEKPDEREKAGKQRQGTIELKAFHQAGQVHLDVIDDGAGIDGLKIAQKALEKKLITQSQLEEMSEQEMARLILKPGFSTSEKVSDVSGRGVGMDVVQTNISHLSGSLSIETKVGYGTKLSLMLPLTLAIVSGLVIRVADQYFIVPEANILELVRIKPEEVKQRINTIHDAQVLRLREKLLPLIDMKTVLNLSPENSDKKETTDGVKPVRVLVARYGKSTIGIKVDSLENFEEIVVKPLPRYMKSLKSYSGASIMGNGKVSLILDIAGLVAKAQLTISEEKEEKHLLNQKDSTENEEQQTLLLFDNKTEERLALPLELITRIEKVSAASIERVKDKTYMQYQGEELRLVFLEDYLPIQKPERTQDETLGVIIPKQVKHRLGLVVGKVYGTLNEPVHLDTKNISSPGLFGSAVLDGKITLLPDLFKLTEMAAPDWYGEDEKKKSGERKLILLVDDTPFFRMIESEYLTSVGYDVIVAENGQQALELLDNHKVDAVVLDIIMPVMDGWQTIEAMRGDDRFKNLPVIAVTSLGDEQSRERGLASGFTEWESKLNKELLLEKLEKMLV